MLKTIGILVVVLIVGVLIFAATKPDTFRVERTTAIKAPPDKIFALIDDFHRWGAWSPYEKLDPTMKRSYSGAASGKGAVYEWEGTSKVGKGRMEIVEASPPAKIAIKLDFMRPFEAHNVAEFTLASKAEMTNVTWAMQGPNPYLGKLMHTFFNMDRMVGGQFEEGLTNLKTVAEK